MLPQPLWLAETQANPRLGASLDSDATADIAIAGGGFVGLWTAIHLKQDYPDLKVAVIEQGRLGEGASGRNGGFVMSWWPKIASLVEIAGEEDGLWLADQSTENVSEMADFLTHHQVDAEFVMGGWLWTATSDAHFTSWADVLNTARRLGRPGIFEEVDPADLARRTGSRRHLRGIFERINGNVHPAKLGYGLAVIAKRLGVTLYEETRVDHIDYGPPVRLRCERGNITAAKLVIATNAWARTIPQVQRNVICVSSAIVATKPIPDQLKRVGWTGGENITDSQSTLDYYRTTRSGRIVFGKGWAKLQYGTEVRPQVFTDHDGIAAAKADFNRMYPDLENVPIEYGWSGPIDRTYDGLPIISTLKDRPHVVFGVGWSGNGVGPSRMGGRMLASLAVEAKNRWTQNAFVGRSGKAFPPEPVRYVVGSMVRDAVVRKDRAEIAGKTPGMVDRMLASLAPAGTEDKR